MEEPIFLTLDHVLRLHERQIERFGGSGGVRDVELIGSAIAQPRQSFNGQYLHGDLIEMAAVYLYHLCKNHGFVDGNKRVAAASALVFLEINGIDTDPIDETAMEAIVLGTAEGKIDKRAVADFFRMHVKLRDRRIGVDQPAPLPVFPPRQRPAAVDRSRELHGWGSWQHLRLPFVLAADGLSIVLLIRYLRRPRRVAAGICAFCGYDLRATPDRCPECGRVPEQSRVVDNPSEPARTLRGWTTRPASWDG